MKFGRPSKSMGKKPGGSILKFEAGMASMKVLFLLPGVMNISLISHWMCNMFMIIFATVIKGILERPKRQE